MLAGGLGKWIFLGAASECPVVGARLRHRTKKGFRQSFRMEIDGRFSSKHSVLTSIGVFIFIVDVMRLHVIGLRRADFSPM